MRVTRPTLGAILILVLAHPGPAGSLPQEADTPASKAEAPHAGHVIEQADVLQVTVWKEEDLTRDVKVRYDGMITLPLIGEVEAAGRTPRQLAEDLTTLLTRYIEHPKVTVGVLEATSPRFFVVGQVGRSGEFPLAGDTTVLQALALAGGFKEFAKTDSIVIVRKDQKVVPVNYEKIANGSDVSQNVQLFPGDTIVVP